MSTTDESLRLSGLSVKLQELQQEFDDLKKALEQDDARYNQRINHVESSLEHDVLWMGQVTDTLGDKISKVSKHCDDLEQRCALLTREQGVHALQIEHMDKTVDEVKKRCDKLDECQTIYDRMIEETNDKFFKNLQAESKSAQNHVNDIDDELEDVHQTCEDLVANHPDASLLSDVAEAETMECDNVAEHFSQFDEDRMMFYTYLREVDKKVKALRPDASSDDDEVDRDDHLDLSYEGFQTKVRAVYESAVRLDTFVKSMKRPRSSAEGDDSSESAAKKVAQ